MPDTFSKLLIHIVFTTKSRAPLISREFRDELYAYIGGIVMRQNAVLLAVGGMPDHVHLLVSIRPSLAVAKLVQLVKANTSKWLNERPDPGETFAWQEGYGAFSVSESMMPKVVAYIRNQESHHRQEPFELEWSVLLRKHGLSAEEV